MDYPDKHIKERIEKILKGKKKQKPLTLQGLGVDENDFLEEKNEEDD